MPGLTASRCSSVCRPTAHARDPVIILTATEDSLSGMERALRAGAVDYLTKPIDAHRVTIRVRGAIERGRLLRELQTLRANFTSMLVHDLRAPLTVIDGYAQLLKSRLGSQADATLLRYTRGIDESAKRMLGLIRQILDVSKFEVGKLTIERLPVDVAAWWPTWWRRSSRRRSSGRSSSPRTAPMRHTPCSARRARLEQVIMKPADQRAEVHAAGGHHPRRARRRRRRRHDRRLRQRPGVPPDERQFLFEPFSQAAAGQQATTPGTGLGLVICRRLVEAHGGACGSTTPRWAAASS